MWATQKGERVKRDVSWSSPSNLTLKRAKFVLVHLCQKQEESYFYCLLCVGDITKQTKVFGIRRKRMYFTCQCALDFTHDGKKCWLIGTELWHRQVAEKGTLGQVLQLAEPPAHELCPGWEPQPHSGHCPAVGTALSAGVSEELPSPSPLPSPWAAWVPLAVRALFSILS